MNTERVPAIVLMVIAVVMLLKSIWVLIGPESFRKFAARWLRMSQHVNTLLGIAMILIALGLWVTVLLDQSLVNWLVCLFGGVAVWGASLYFRPASLDKFGEALVLRRSRNFLRVFGVIGALVAMACAWVAINGF